MGERESSEPEPWASPVTAVVCAPGETNRALRAMGMAADKVMGLVQRALSYLESDQQAALRCLRDLSRLLGADAHGSDTGAHLALRRSPGGLAVWQARRAITYIEENLGSAIGTPELAALVCLSRSHFARAFRRSLGTSPMVYVAQRRVERAKLMMLSTGQTLSDIACACGFADQSHLSHWFRRIVGVSPGLWRRTIPQE